MANIIAGIIVVIVVALIIFKLVRDKKAGRNSCGCGCSACSASEVCHPSADKLTLKKNEDGEIEIESK